jgi:hypothetical protein
VGRELRRGRSRITVTIAQHARQLDTWQADHVAGGFQSLTVVVLRIFALCLALQIPAQEGNSITNGLNAIPVLTIFPDARVT